MGLTYCESCRALEGDVNETEDGTLVCGECGDDSITFIPEHDDFDMERQQ